MPENRNLFSCDCGCQMELELDDPLKSQKSGEDAVAVRIHGFKASEGRVPTIWLNRAGVAALSAMLEDRRIIMDDGA